MIALSLYRSPPRPLFFPSLLSIFLPIVPSLLSAPVCTYVCVCPCVWKESVPPAEQKLLMPLVRRQSDVKTRDSSLCYTCSVCCALGQSRGSPRSLLFEAAHVLRVRPPPSFVRSSEGRACVWVPCECRGLCDLCSHVRRVTRASMCV